MRKGAFGKSPARVESNMKIHENTKSSENNSNPTVPPKPPPDFPHTSNVNGEGMASFCGMVSDNTKGQPQTVHLSGQHQNEAPKTKETTRNLPSNHSKHTGTHAAPGNNKSMFKYKISQQTELCKIENKMLMIRSFRVLLPC